MPTSVKSGLWSSRRDDAASTTGSEPNAYAAAASPPTTARNLKLAPRQAHAAPGGVGADHRGATATYLAATSKLGLAPRQSRDNARCVPTMQIANGRITRRHFDFLNPHFCAACNEPVEAWDRHIGRKDHSLLDQHFEALVEYDRTWSAEQVLLSFHDVFVGPGNSSANRSSDRNATAIFLARGLSSLHLVFAEEERQRRLELLLMTTFLLERGVIDASNSRAAAHRGSFFGVFLAAHLAIHHVYPESVMRVFPAASPDHCSQLEDFVSSSYNHETLWDMCGFSSLLRFHPHHTRQQHAGTATTTTTTTSPSSTAAAHAASSSGDGGASSATLVLGVAGKSQMFRILLSQLKPALLEDQAVEFASDVDATATMTARGPNVGGGVGGMRQQQATLVAGSASSSSAATAGDDDDDDAADPRGLDHQDGVVSVEGAAFRGAMETLMSILGRGLVAELVHCRISEYVVRAEPVWLRVGQVEQLRLPTTGGGGGGGAGGGGRGAVGPGGTRSPGRMAPSSPPDPRAALGRATPDVRVTMSARPERDARPWIL